MAGKSNDRSDTLTKSRIAFLVFSVVLICAGILTKAAASEKTDVVGVRGTQLILEDKPYIIKGVNWSPATRAPDKGIDPAQPNRVISYGFFFDMPYGRSKGYEVWDYWMKKEYGRHYKTDIRLIKDMGVTTVRIRNFGTDKNAYKRILDELHDNGIKVIMTLDVAKREIGDLKRLRNIINLCKDHPAMLMWSMEPAWNIQANQYYEYGSPENTIKAINAAAKAIKSIDPNHPVDVSIAEMIFGDDGPGSGKDFVQNCDAVDVVGVTVYSERGLKSVLKQWKKLTAKPLYISRMGTDSFKTEKYELINKYQAIKVIGKEDQKTQADYIIGLWDIVKNNLSATDPENVCLGAMVTEFNDTLWPAGSYHFGMGGIFDYSDIGHEARYKEYDADGMYFKGGAPDDVVNVEYTGIVDADRKPKLAYSELQRYYKELGEAKTDKK